MMSEMQKVLLLMTGVEPYLGKYCLISSGACFGLSRLMVQISHL